MKRGGVALIVAALAVCALGVALLVIRAKRERVVVVRVVDAGGGALHQGATEDEGDALLLETLRKRGEPMDRQHAIDFFAYFPDEQAARGACERLAREGFRAPDVTTPDEPEGAWRCRVTRDLPLDAGAIRDARVQVTALATAAGGEYDGWEVAPASADAHAP